MNFFYKKLSFYYKESDFLFLYKKFNFRFKNILYQKFRMTDKKGIPQSTKLEIHVSRLQRQRQTKF